MKFKNKSYFYASAVTILGYSLLNIAIAFRFADVLNLVQTRDMPAFFAAVMQTMLVIFLLALFYYLKEKFKRKHIAQEIQTVSQDIFASVVYSNEDVNTGEMISLLTNDITSSLTAEWNLRYVLAENILLLVFAVGTLFVLHKSLSVAVVLAALVLVHFPRLFKVSLAAKKQEQTRTLAHFNNLASGTMEGFDTVQTFGAEAVFQKQLTKQAAAWEAANVRYKRAASFAHHVQFGFSTIVQMMILLLAAVFIAKGYLEIGAILMVGQLLSFVSEPIEQILSSRNEVFANHPIAERIKVLTQRSRETGEIDKVKWEEGLHIEDVCFSYGEKKIFEKLNLFLEKGKKYAVVGKSGAGKSTLLHLLNGTLTPDSGTVRIDAVPVQQLTRHARAALFQSVGQDVFLFADTVKQNIFLYGTFSEDAYHEALKKVNMADTIDALEKKGDTVIGTAASDLSGGQKQRIQIARGLIRDKDIYLLDEMTSQLDAENARRVEETICGLDKTVVAVRHRVDESLRNYDAVIVLDNGQAKMMCPDAYLHAAGFQNQIKE